MEDTLALALEEVRKRLPVDLDRTVETQKDGVTQLMTFDDNHIFTLGLPAWVLRAIKHASSNQT